jgi:ssDNA-binding Zn-finger/Zn-ribbon topoisomerase 1
MKMRTAGKGSRAGQPFWGCSDYPRCKEIIDIVEVA